MTMTTKRKMFQTRLSRTGRLSLIIILISGWLDPGQAEAQFVMSNRPSLRLGQELRVDLRARLQSDFRGFSPDLETDEGMFDIHRARLGIEGKFLRHFDYQVERELREHFGGLEPKHPWKDVYVNFDYFDNFQIQAGKFKIPFGLEQLTSASNLDFVNRALIASDLTPAREQGVALHGRFFKRGISYDAGVFRYDGENSESHTDVRGKTAYALRLNATPLRPLRLPLDLGKIELGIATVSSDVPEGLNSLRGHTYSGKDFFNHVYVKGRRLRVGTEFNWQPGPFTLKSEWIQVGEERNDQSIRETDLPSKVSRGWYVVGAWVLTGESSDGGVQPRHPFPNSGIGAIEIATRLEQERFGSSEHPGTAQSGPRSANIFGNSDRAWTAGINWYLNRFVKVQLNGIHETIEDVNRAPITGREKYWMGILRLQFSM
jgi:phosphate-selective porin OprO and OprP